MEESTESPVKGSPAHHDDDTDGTDDGDESDDSSESGGYIEAGEIRQDTDHGSRPERRHASDSEASECGTSDRDEKDDSSNSGHREADRAESDDSSDSGNIEAGEVCQDRDGRMHKRRREASGDGMSDRDQRDNSSDSDHREADKDESDDSSDSGNIEAGDLRQDRDGSMHKRRRGSDPEASGHGTADRDERDTSSDSDHRESDRDESDDSSDSGNKEAGDMWQDRDGSMHKRKRGSNPEASGDGTSDRYQRDNSSNSDLREADKDESDDSSGDGNIEAGDFWQDRDSSTQKRRRGSDPEASGHGTSNRDERDDSSDSGHRETDRDESDDGSDSGKDRDASMYKRKRGSDSEASGHGASDRDQRDNRSDSDHREAGKDERDDGSDSGNKEAGNIWQDKDGSMHTRKRGSDSEASGHGTSDRDQRDNSSDSDHREADKDESNDISDSGNIQAGDGGGSMHKRRWGSDSETSGHGISDKDERDDGNDGGHREADRDENDDISNSGNIEAGDIQQDKDGSDSEASGHGTSVRVEKDDSNVSGHREAGEIQQDKDESEHNRRRGSYSKASGYGISDIMYRILCPTSKIGAVIGKGGSSIKFLRFDTKAEIKVENLILGCNERVIYLSSAPGCDRDGRSHDSDDLRACDEDEMLCPAQEALFRIYHCIIQNDRDEPCPQVTIRLLVSESQVGYLIGRGGRVIEQMRKDIAAQIQVLPKALLPVCAYPSDGLVQLFGTPALVKKALYAVSSKLYENLVQERSHQSSGVSQSAGGGMYSSSFHAPGSILGMGPHGRSETGKSSSMPSSRNDGSTTEELMVCILCPKDKVGNMIGKGGNVIRKLREDSAANINVCNQVEGSDEQVIEISAIESADSSVSPVLEAVLLVYRRFSEISADRKSKSSNSSIRLLVRAHQIGCLLGKRGQTITEMRKSSRAKIRIPPKDELPRCADEGRELVQISGEAQMVEAALVQVLTILRSNLFKGQDLGHGIHLQGGGS